MKKTRFFLRWVNLEKVFLPFGILLIIAGSLLNAAVVPPQGHWAWSDLIGSDGASVVLSAISHNRGLGVPYKDYWEYRPPGFLFLIDFWVKVFGFKIFAFKLLELLIRFGIGLQIYFLARKIFPLFQAFVVFCLTGFVFFSPAFGTMMLAEPYGLFFSLVGLLILLYTKRFVLRFFLAGFFLALSGQMKDSYGGGILAIIPPLFSFLTIRDYRSFVKGLASSFCGYLSLVFIIWFYLTSLGSLNSYLEVFSFKSHTFNLRFWENIEVFLRQYHYAFQHSNDFLVFFHYSVVFILILWFFLFLLLKNRSLFPLAKIKNNALILKVPSFNFSLSKERLNVITYLFYALGSFIGFTLNKGFSPHYLTQIIIPLYFFWAIIVLSIESSLKSLFKTLKSNLVFLSVSLFLLLPASWILLPYTAIPKNFTRQAYKNLTLSNGDISVEKYIGSKTKKEDCVLSLYGWKSGEVYLYSKRQPCSRFVAPNVVNDEWQRREYRAALQENPPQAIVYSLDGADMDVARFEREVIDFTRILNRCYQQDFAYTDNGRWPLKLYFPVYSNENLKTCIKENTG